MSDVLREHDFIVPWSGRSEEEIDRELKRLDPDLYLDMEIDYAGGPVHYVVKHNTGSGADGQVRVVVWKEMDGTPRPLTHEIVEQVKRQEGRADGLVQEILAAEEKRRERERATSADEHAAIMDDHLARIKAASDRSLPPNWRPRRFGAK